MLVIIFAKGRTISSKIYLSLLTNYSLLQFLHAEFLDKIICILFCLEQNVECIVLKREIRGKGQKNDTNKLSIFTKQKTCTMFLSCYGLNMSGSLGEREML